MQILIKLPFQLKYATFLFVFVSFDLSCSILEKDNFIKNVYIVLSY